MIDIELWILESNEHLTREHRNTISVDILELCLIEYQSKWEELLDSLAPKQYSSKESTLNELNILSKKDNPVSALIKIVSENTNLDDIFYLEKPIA